MRATKITLIAMMMALPAMAQSDVTPEQAHKVGTVLSSLFSSMFGPMVDVLMQPVITGEPYTASSFKSEEKTLADGTVITHHGRYHLMTRDAEGRIRVEHTLFNGTTKTPVTKMIYVKDPVAGTLTMWSEGGKETAKKTAEVMKLPDLNKDKPKPVALGNPKTPAKPDPNVTTEELGQQSIQGVMVTGVRTTTVIPVGADGNDRPITKTKEVWTAPDLQLTVREVTTDPRRGKTTVELVDLSREDPPIATFQPPAGYTIQKMEDVVKQAQAKAQAEQAKP